MVYGNFIGRKKFETTGTHDGGHFSGVPWVSALINGRGRYIHPESGKLHLTNHLIVSYAWIISFSNKKKTYFKSVIGNKLH